jgi:heat shock protein beta-11
MSEVVFSSSFDDKFLPSNVLISGNREYWVSTGLYPQELFIQMESEKLINSVSISTYAVKRITFESCENDSAVNFTKQAEMNDVPFKDGKLQEFFLNFNQQKPSKLIKMTINEGYDDFCSVHSISFK